jgi:hypothetical protein
MRWRTPIRLVALAGVFTLATVAPSTAGPFTRSPLKVVSVSSSSSALNCVLCDPAPCSCG